MNRVGKILILSFLSLLVIACGSDRSREDQVAAMINKIDNPFVVLNLTPQNLMDKSGVRDGAVPFTYELITGLFLDDSLTGIDYAVKTQLVVAQGKGITPSAYVIFKVKDSEKFKEMLETEANADIKEKEGYTYTVQDGDQYVVVWNEEFAMFSNIPMDIASMLTGGGKNSGDGQVNVCIDLMNAAEDGDVSPEFSEFLKKDDDIAIYYDGEAMYGYLEEMSMGQAEEMEQFKDIYEGMSYQLFMNFNKGSMEMSWESDLSDKLMEDLSFIGKGGVDKKLLAYGNSAKPVMVGSYNVNFKGAMEYVEKMAAPRDMEEMEEGLAEMGMTMDDIKSAISGELVFAIDRIETKEETWDFGYGEPYTYTTTEPVIGVAIGVENKATIEKALKSVMTAGPEMNDLAAEDMEMDEVLTMIEEGGRGPSMEMQANGVMKADEAYIYLGKKVLFVCNDSAWAQKVAKGNGVKIKDPKGDLGKNPFAIYANFETLAKMENLDEAEDFVKMFTEFSGGANLEAGSFTLSMKNKSKNALRVMTEVISNQLNEMDERMNMELKEELDASMEEGFDKLEEEEMEEGMGCEAGACEAGACEGGH